jgi:hypothetical protein
MESFGKFEGMNDRRERGWKKDLDRLVIHFLFLPLKLARGVDRFSLASVGVLVQYAEF